MTAPAAAMIISDHDHGIMALAFRWQALKSRFRPRGLGGPGRRAAGPRTHCPEAIVTVGGTGR